MFDESEGSGWTDLDIQAGAANPKHCEPDEYLAPFLSISAKLVSNIIQSSVCVWRRTLPNVVPLSAVCYEDLSHLLDIPHQRSQVVYCHGFDM